MIWQNPWAWTGLLALSLPIIIHLLGRGHARVQKFPTLRFLQVSRLLPTRRTRLQDLPLLFIRLMILLAAVAALAQPLLLTTNRKRTLDSSLVRAIIVDTSASMVGPKLDAARKESQRLSSEATSTVVLNTVSPAGAIPGALAWLRQHSGRDELIVLSDFQVGTLHLTDLVGVPANVGITLTRIGGDTDTVIPERAVVAGGELIRAHITTTPERTQVDWSAASEPAHSSVAVLVGPDEHPVANAAKVAAATIPIELPISADHPIVVVYPHAEQRTQLLGEAKPLFTPWMTDAAVHLSRDSLLLSASNSATVVGDSTHVGALVLARNQRGEPLVFALESARERPTLLLFIQADPGSLTSASLIAAATRTMSLAPPISESEPRLLDEGTLRSWQRPSPKDAVIDLQRGGENADSDGRWLWGAALLLLTLEWFVRRRPKLTGLVHDQPA